MPPKQPSYLDMLKEGATAFFTDPTFTVPTGIAGITAGINYGAKKLGPDFASKAMPAVGAAVKRASNAAGQAIKTGAQAVRPAIRTYMPALNDAIDAAKVNYDLLAPKVYLAAKKDIGKPFSTAYNAVAKSPVGRGIAKGARFVGTGVKAVDKALYSGVGGKAHRIVDAAMLGSPAGDPYFNDARLAKNRQQESILGAYNFLSKPGYLDRAAQTPEGQREARLALMTLEDSMNKAGLPQQVKDHFYAAIRGGAGMDNADRQSMINILEKHIPLNQQFDDPTFRGGGQPSVGDLLTVGTFGLNNIINAASGNAFPWMSDKQMSGDMAIERHQNSRSGMIAKRQQMQMSNLMNHYNNLIQSGKMSQPDAQAEFEKSAKILGLR